MFFFIYIYKTKVDEIIETGDKRGGREKMYRRYVAYV